MNIRNRVVSKIEAAKYELETTIEMELDYTKSDGVKTTNSLDMNISDITPNKPYSSD